jgi:hypothetical protein
MDTLPPPPPESTGIPLPLVPSADLAGGLSDETPRTERPTRLWWQRTLAILGLVFLFPVLLTIPFWGQLRQYRRWKEGDRDRLTGLMIWGAVASVWFLGVIAFASSEPTAPQAVAVVPTPQTSDHVTEVPTIEEARLDTAVDHLLGKRGMMPLAKFCQAYGNKVGYERFWQLYDKVAGPGLFEGFTNLEIFDEIVSRCLDTFVDRLIATIGTASFEQLCQTYEGGGEELIWQAWYKSTGSELLSGFASREIFDELVSRC